MVLPAFAPENPGTWQPLFDQAHAAEQAGFDGLALSGEHVAFGENLEAYRRAELGGRLGGEQPTDSNGYFLEPLTTLAALSRTTSRIRFTTLIMLAALRRPLLLAKTAATLDVLSVGRLELGVGVGWQQEEYEAAGLDFRKRGRLLDQTLDVCQTLWRQTRANYSSEELSFSGIHMMPKPLQADGVPLWVSGTVNRGAMRRLARFGTGWIPWAEAWYEPASLITTIPAMREAISGYGRDPAEVGVAGRLPVISGPDGNPAISRTMAEVPPLLEAGVTDFYAVLRAGPQIDAVEYLTQWVTAFRDVTT
jgi:probable F420-dependent oxidoreductase